MARTLIGTRIRERRRAQGLTQIALAQAVGISPSYLNLIEHNKRGIAGRTLISLARELGLQPGDLSEAGDEETLSQLLDTARTLADGTAEIDRIEEFVGRYPGWARLLTRLSDLNRSQTERLRALSDRMAQDPFLSETMHQILSNITAIRSIAGILADGDVPADVQARFVDNLSKDSERLSETAQAMVEFFDTEDFSDIAPPDDSMLWPDPGEGGATVAAQQAPVRIEGAQRLAEAEALMPLDRFVAEAQAAAYDPLVLASVFGAEPWQVLLRLAHIPRDISFPRFGLIECDMSGAILLRKPVAELNPPQFSSGCPLWPVYRAFARPRQVLRGVLDMPSGDRLMCYAVAHAASHGGYDMPPMLRSVMVFCADPAVVAAGRDQRTLVLAGLHCSVCPRKQCSERRIDYILA